MFFGPISDKISKNHGNNYTKMYSNTDCEKVENNVCTNKIKLHRSGENTWKKWKCLFFNSLKKDLKNRPKNHEIPNIFEK
jgi:hypothetical protein